MYPPVVMPPIPVLGVPLVAPSLAPTYSLPSAYDCRVPMFAEALRRSSDGFLKNFQEKHHHIFSEAPTEEEILSKLTEINELLEKV